MSQIVINPLWEILVNNVLHALKFVAYSKWASVNLESGRGATYENKLPTIYVYSEWPKHSVCHGSGERRQWLGVLESWDEVPEFIKYAESQGVKFDVVTGGTQYQEFSMPSVAPAWFDEADAGERWDSDY